MAKLKTLDFDPPIIEVPRRIIRMLDDADERIERFHFDHRDSPVAAYVPSDFVSAYHALAAIVTCGLAPGTRFVEWGCGVGVVTCMAAELGFDAVGIETEEELVEQSAQLAADHEIDAEFITGSFVPEQHEDLFDNSGDFNWVRIDRPSAYEEIGLEPDDFDLVYCYPWPGEEYLSESLFQRCGATGALLLSYHGREGFRLRRRV